jgi:hypothetical protein
MSIPTRPNQKSTEILSYDDKGRGKSFLFTITEPNSLNPLYDYALAIHQNPESLSEKYTKSKSSTMTYGGFVEWHWPDELDTISCTASTGAFMHRTLGLMWGPASTQPDTRHDTIAYQRMLQLIDIFKNNGMIYDDFGTPSIRGRVIMAFDRGVYYGHFSNFSVEETSEMSFHFGLSWDFKVERVVTHFNNLV